MSLSCFLGRRLGDLLYCFDAKHRAIAHANIKTAFGRDLDIRQLNRLTLEFYRSFGQNLIEVFFIPFIDKKYMDRYVSFEGLQFIAEAFSKGKGVILLGAHAGSWELSNIICANLGFPFSVIVREQKFPHLNQLLNSYRRQKGCKLIERQAQTRQLIEALKNNEAVGLTVDQGGRDGCLVEFFGKNASMATGAVKLALKYDAVILPAYYTRVRGPYIKTIIGAPFQIKKTGRLEEDIRNNLQELVRVFEKNIRKYPKDYLWTYKIWKYSDKKNILILSDGKAGHLRQAQAVAKIAEGLLRERGLEVSVGSIEVKFRQALARKAFLLSVCLAAKSSCQGCLWCMRRFLEKENYRSLFTTNPDVVISSGSSLAPVNFVLSCENLAKSIVVMRPSVLSTRRFDLVIMPSHDNPPKRKNIIVTEGALNLIDEQYLKEQSERLAQVSGLRSQVSGCIGLLMGGDTKDFSLTQETVSEVAKEIKKAASDLGADILTTSSRRTSKETEEILKKEFRGYERCKLLIVANEKNIPEAVGGILGLSQIVVISPESISMISEAAGSGKHVIVFKAAGLSRKHRVFLDNFSKKKYIYMTEVGNLSGLIKELWLNLPPISVPQDNSVIREALKCVV